MSSCSSRISGLGDVFPDMEGMNAILFGDQADRADVLSPSRAAKAARLCSLHVVDGVDWDRAADRVRARQGSRPLFHAELIPQTVWSFKNVPLVFVWPQPQGRGCTIAVFSGDRDDAVRGIIAEVSKQMNADSSSLDSLTIASLETAPMPSTLVASGSDAYFFSAELVELDDPFATSGAGLLFSFWRQEAHIADG